MKLPGLERVRRFSIAPWQWVLAVSICLGLWLMPITSSQPLAVLSAQLLLVQTTLVTALAMAAFLWVLRPSRRLAATKLATHRRVRRDGMAYYFYFGLSHALVILMALLLGLTLLWFFGPRPWTLIASAALHSCALFLLIGVLSRPRIGLSTLGLLWRVRPQGPDQAPLQHIATELMLSQRYAQALAQDSRNGGLGLAEITRALDVGERSAENRDLALWGGGLVGMGHDLMARLKACGTLAATAAALALVLMIALPKDRIRPDFQPGKAGRLARWIVTKNPLLNQAEDEIRRLEEQLKQPVETDTMIADDALEYQTDETDDAFETATDEQGSRDETATTPDKMQRDTPKPSPDRDRETAKQAEANRPSDQQRDERGLNNTDGRRSPKEGSRYYQADASGARMGRVGETQGESPQAGESGANQAGSEARAGRTGMVQHVDAVREESRVAQAKSPAGGADGAPNGSVAGARPAQQRQGAAAQPGAAQAAGEKQAGRQSGSAVATSAKPADSGSAKAAGSTGTPASADRQSGQTAAMDGRKAGQPGQGSPAGSGESQGASGQSAGKTGQRPSAGQMAQGSSSGPPSGNAQAAGQRQGAGEGNRSAAAQNSLADGAAPQNGKSPGAAAQGGGSGGSDSAQGDGKGGGEGSPQRNTHRQARLGNSSSDDQTQKTTRAAGSGGGPDPGMGRPRSAPPQGQPLITVSLPPMTDKVQSLRAGKTKPGEEWSQTKNAESQSETKGGAQSKTESGAAKATAPVQRLPNWILLILDPESNPKKTE